MGRIVTRFRPTSGNGPLHAGHFRSYFEAMTTWSGIGFARGARLGHYQGLKNLGLHGRVFFIPQDDSAQSQADMEAYVAAARDGDWPADHEPWRPPSEAFPSRPFPPSRFRAAVRGA